MHDLIASVELTELWAEVVDCCQRSPVGKLLPQALYVHWSALESLEPPLQQYEQLARSCLDRTDNITLVKFHLDQPQVSYLFYPDFETDPHPALLSSAIVHLGTHQVSYRDYSETDNPPVLHRKETFLTPDHPLYQHFADLTQQEEVLGLLDQSRSIGTRQGWEERLRQYGVQMEGHQLVRQLQSSGSGVATTPKIERHRAALPRTSLSKPVRLALEAGLLSREEDDPERITFFDYGCGYGGDIDRIAAQGYASSGWDPYYQPDQPLQTAAVVNLGYIINVIEDAAERRQALVQAWSLTGKVLIVAAQVLIEDRMRGQVAYGDGVITRRNTFQKYFEQEELKRYIDQVLTVDAVPVALGIYFVFRDPVQAESFRAARFRSRTTTPRVKASVRRFETYRELLAPLMAFFTERGRLPLVDELPAAQEIVAQLGTLKRAFQVVLQATEVQEWDAISDRRRQDLLVYLALSRFSRRPKFQELSASLQNDLKALFGSYHQACTAADLMLASLGEPDVIAACCQRSLVGRWGGGGLWVHVSALEGLEPMLRLYEGCASRTIGRPEEATLVKFHARKPKISYLVYPQFDDDPHPALQTSMQIDLRDLSVSYRDYDPAENPPVLHWKEAYITSDYPLYEKFAKLTRQEVDWGLLDKPETISHRREWLKCLQEHCAELQGHRVVWCKSADPYRVKLQRSLIRSRQTQRQQASNSSS